MNPNISTTSIPEFQHYQHQFVDYLRDPHNEQARPNTLPAASSIYAELYYSTIEDCLQNCFPISCELLGADIWQKLVQLFIQQHRCQSPLYREIPNEFMDYLLGVSPEKKELGIEIPEFIYDLAHYEWVELVLETAVDEPSHCLETFPIRVTSSLRVPVLNPVLHVLHYRYPVQHITAANEYWRNWQEERLKPYDQTPTILAGFRDKDYQVHFAELNTVTARLVELLQGEKRNQEHILLQLADEIHYSDPKQFLEFGQDILTQLAEQQIIIGAINEY